MAIGLLSPRILRLRDDDTPLPLSPPEARPDLAFLARPLFVRLGEALRSAAQLLSECRAMEERSTRHERAWGVPKLFFSDRAAQAEWRSIQSPIQAFPEPFLSLLAPAFPKLADAWDRLPGLLDDALALMGESQDVRRMARAVPGLREAARSVPQAGELAGILGMPEEEVWLIVHPAARAGYRVALEGVADIAQLHVLLADRLTGDPCRGLLAGSRPAFDAVDAYRGTGHTESVVATSRFRFHRPEALRPDGTLPEGFAGSATWYWGRETLDTVPRTNGERVLLIGEPEPPTTWEVARRFPRIEAKVGLVEVLKRAEIESWLRARCPALRPSIVPVARAA